MEQRLVPSHFADSGVGLLEATELEEKETKTCLTASLRTFWYDWIWLHNIKTHDVALWTMKTLKLTHCVKVQSLHDEIDY